MAKRAATATDLAKLMSDLSDVRQGLEALRRTTRGGQQQDAQQEVLAWKSACSAFLALPGLRGFWPLSSFNEAGNAYDLSGQGRTMTYNGDPLYNQVGLASYLAFDGTGDYLSRADEAGLDVIGTESYVASASQGLTMGGWFYFDNAPGSVEGMMAKWDPSLGNHRSYMLRRQAAAGNVILAISGNGATSTSVQSIAIPATGRWFWAAGRFDPGAEEAIFIDAEKTVNTTAIPASIFNGDSPLWIGRADTDLMTGRIAMCFLCATALDDAIVYALYHQTRGLFRRW